MNQNPFSFAIRWVVLAGLGVALTTHAENFTTNIVNGVFSNGTTVLVGSTGMLNFLGIRNGGVLSNTTGNVGSTSASANNFVSVSGTNSVNGRISLWYNDGSLSIGRSGSHSQLIVTNGAGVEDDSGYLGFAAGSTSNSVIVTGLGSYWSSGTELFVGRLGGSNTVTIADSGELDSSASTIGSNSAANLVLMTGVDSYWFNDSDVIVGSLGANNRLTINSGGGECNSMFVGMGATGTNNTVTLSGADSFWSVTSNIVIGVAGASNSVIVADGAALDNFAAIIGSNSTGNALLVAGTDTFWYSTNRVVVGYVIGGNRLTMTNAASAETVKDVLIGLGAASSNNVVTLVNTDTLWSADASFVVGVAGASNRVTITHGAELDSDAGIIGSNSTRNVVILSDNGFWSISGNLSVGLNGATNQLIITGDGEVDASNIVVGVASVANQLALNSGFISATSVTVRAGNRLTGCGFIDADVVNNGLITNDCGTLLFTGIVTNNGTIASVNNSFLWFDDLVVNNGTIITTNGTVKFFAGIENNGTVLLDGGGDADNDGMTNAWEITYGLDPLDDSDAALDKDGDGQSNLAEFLTGTDPTNSASYFSITGVAQVDVDVLVTWTMGPGKTNALQRATNLTGGFSDVFTVTNTTGTATNYLDLGAATNLPAFYRVRLVP